MLELSYRYQTFKDFSSLVPRMRAKQLYIRYQNCPIAINKETKCLLFLQVYEKYYVVIFINKNIKILFFYWKVFFWIHYHITFFTNTKLRFDLKTIQVSQLGL